MWWINKSGQISGPFDEVEVRRQIDLGLLRSLDSVSNDRRLWKHLRETAFWAVPKPVPAPPLGGHPRATRQPPPPPPPRPVIRPPVEPVAPSEGVRLTTDDLLPRQVSDGRKRLPLAILYVSLLGLVAMMICLGGFWLTRGASSVEAEKVVVEATRSRADAEAKGGKDLSFVESCVAIVTCQESSGSGFLLRMDRKEKGAKVFLVSNEHVFRSKGMPKAVLPNGVELKLDPQQYFVAPDRDLACFEVINPPTNVLLVAQNPPHNEDEAICFGNSGGVGAITRNPGKVLGVGPIRLEVSCEWIGGNSGGPIVNANGNVIAVATMSSRGDLAESNPFNKGTRYGEKIRRFGTRLLTSRMVQWQWVDRQVYQRQCSKCEDFEAYCLSLLHAYQTVAAKLDKDQQPFAYSAQSKERFNDPDGTGFHEMLLALNEDMSTWLPLFVKISVALEARQNGSRDPEPSKADFEELRRRTIAVHRKIQEACRLGISFVDGIAWLAPQFMKGHNVDDEDRDRGNAFKEFLKEMQKDSSEHIEKLTK